MPEADQYRFLIKSAKDGLVEIAWSCERDHHPVAVGSVQVRADGAAEDPVLREARAYLLEWQRSNGRTL